MDEIFDIISYSKGASVIRMLHNYIGDEVSKYLGLRWKAENNLITLLLLLTIGLQEWTSSIFDYVFVQECHDRLESLGVWQRCTQGLGVWLRL